MKPTLFLLLCFFSLTSFGQVESTHCPRMKGILFQQNSLQLMNSQEENGIKTIVEVLNKMPEIFLSIEGHTDEGESSEDTVLSYERAKLIKQKIMDYGISETRLTIRGKGNKYPVADPKTQDGAILNRRVDFKILPTIK